MPNPTPTSVHIDRALTNVSTAYFQQADGYVAPRVFASVPVDAQTNSYYVFDKNDALRDKAEERAPGDESAGGGFRVSTDSYKTQVYAWHVDLSDQVRANADAGLNLMRSAARTCTAAIMRKMEQDWAATAFATGVWTIDLDAGTDFTAWSADNSTPISDVETQRLAISAASGYEPNTLVLGAAVYSRLKNHPEFRERMIAVSDQLVNRQIMANIFEVDNLYVARAIHATNVEGETAAYARLLGNHAWLGYVPSAPAMEEPSAGYAFVWSEVSDGTIAEVGTVQIDMPWKRVIRIESQLSWDFKITGLDMAAFFENAV